MRSFLFTLIVVIICHNSFACQCPPKGPINYYEFAHRYDKIFTGKVLYIRKLNDWLSLYSFRVTKDWKNAPEGKLIMVEIPTDSGACGMEINLNEVWVLTVNVEGKTLVTNRCRKNGKEGEEEFVANTEQLKKISSFKNGHVKLFDFYSNKIVIAQGNLRNGVQIGEWKYYHNNGDLRFKGGYANGKRQGLWEEFRFDGFINHRNEFLYQNGALLKEIRYWDKQKTEVIDYYSTGNLEYVERKFENSIMIRSFEYTRDGKVAFKKYDKEGRVIETDSWERRE